MGTLDASMKNKKAGFVYSINFGTIKLIIGTLHTKNKHTNDVIFPRIYSKKDNRQIKMPNKNTIYLLLIFKSTNTKKKTGKSR